MSSRNEKRLITGKRLKMTSDFTPLPQLDEGEYVGHLVRKTQSPPRWGRQDLVMEFEVQADDFEPVLVSTYFQVKWIDNETFNAGPKSDYFRTYQTCFGRVSSTEFSISMTSPRVLIPWISPMSPRMGIDSRLIRLISTQR